jgi:hypothetical protein
MPAAAEGAAGIVLFPIPHVHPPFHAMKGDFVITITLLREI